MNIVNLLHQRSLGRYVEGVLFHEIVENTFTNNVCISARISVTMCYFDIILLDSISPSIFLWNRPSFYQLLPFQCHPTGKLRKDSILNYSYMLSIITLKSCDTHVHMD